MEQLAITLHKRDGKLYPLTNQDRVRLQAFTDLLAEGTKVDVYLSIQQPANHSLAQLAKVHAGIRDLAVESGQDQASIKELIKQEAGLTVLGESGRPELKSFRDCTKEELSRAIQVVVKYCDDLGITQPATVDPLSS